MNNRRFAMVIVVLALLLVPLVQAVANTVPSHATTHGIASAPSGLLAAIVRTQARAVANNSTYFIGHNGCAKLENRNSTLALAGCFGQRGPAFTAGTSRVHLTLTAWGYKGQLQSVVLTRMAPRANRIEYRGRHIAEWWRVLPLGYEQGFMIKHAPAGTGPVILQLTASAAPTLHNGELAWGKLRYGKLHVVDATGKVLPATLSAHGKIITLAFDAAHARYPVSVDPLVWVQQQEVTASNGAANDNFGSLVALSGDGTTALVGAYGKNTGQGAAYVYTLANGTWSQAAELTASNGAPSDGFGISVALSSAGTTALVGAFHKTVGSNSYQGAAYVYTEPSSGWATTSAYTAYLTAANGAAGDWFGISVALSSTGTTALVGAYWKTVGSNTGQGAAYVYTEPSGGWASTVTYTAYLTAANGAASDNFGRSVALSSTGTTALVGADNGNGGKGAAYVYTEPSSGWATTSVYTAYLTAANGAASDYFGSSVALSGDGTTALVGAYWKTVGSNIVQGAAYVYTEPSGGWASTAIYTAELTASDGAAGDYFGTTVALSSTGTTALVGAYDSKSIGGNTGQGAAYVYMLAVGTWSQVGELTASDGAANDHFGSSVALSSTETTALVGAYGKNSAQGVAYFFTGANLSAVLSAPATVIPGGQFDSQYILTNNSNSASGDVQVVLPAPVSGASVAAVSSTGPKGVFGCTQNGTTQVVTCDLGAIPGNGGSGSATLTLQATGTLGSSIAQSAQLAGGVSTNLVQNATTTINNSAPVASNLSLSTYAGQTLSGTLPAVVTPSNDVLSYAIASQPTHGTVTVNATTGAFTYTPTSGYSGPDSFTFTATDTVTGLSSNTATVSITINATPAPGQVPPVASNLSLSTYAGQALAGTLPAVVTPSSDTLSYAIASQPAHGTATVNAATGAFTYTPTSGYSGPDSFTFTATDTVTGLSSNTATVTFTINVTPAPGQVPPVASNLSLSTYVGQALAGTLPAVVTPSSDVLSYALASQPTHGTVTVNATTGAFTYTPTSGYSGPDSFTFTAQDTVTGLTSNIATVSITVKAIPAAPPAPSGNGGGGGALGPWTLAALFGLMLLAALQRRRKIVG